MDSWEGIEESRWASYGFFCLLVAIIATLTRKYVAPEINSLIIMIPAVLAMGFEIMAIMVLNKNRRASDKDYRYLFGGLALLSVLVMLNGFFKAF